MAVKMGSGQLFKLLTEMFGVDSPELKQVKALVAAGHTVNSGLFNFYVQVGEQRFEYTSPVMLAKFASQNHLVQDMVKDKVSEVLHKATDFVGGVTSSESWGALATSAVGQLPLYAEGLPPVQPESTKESSVIGGGVEVEATAQSGPVNLSKPKPVDAVIKLSEARAVGQKVRGTNAGSVYRAVAIGSVNVAIRLQSTTISIRAEFQKERDASVVSKLVAMGFTDHTDYLSIHLKLDGTPPSRVLGAILYGMEVEFDQISTTIGAANV